MQPVIILNAIGSAAVRRGVGLMNDVAAWKGVGFKNDAAVWKNVDVWNEICCIDDCCWIAGWFWPVFSGGDKIDRSVCWDVGWGAVTTANRDVETIVDGVKFFESVERNAAASFKNFESAVKDLGISENVDKNVAKDADENKGKNAVEIAVTDASKDADSLKISERVCGDK